MRISFIRKTIMICFAALILYLWHMQCIQGPRYIELSQKNRIRLVSLAAPRGNIYDKNNNLLVGNRIAFDCAVIPQEFPSDDETFQKLNSILRIPADVLKKKIKENTAASFIAVTFKKDIGKEAAIAISERSMDIPGLIIRTYPVRYYPGGNTGSHVMGYLGKISEEELCALRDYGYKVRDFMGRGGLELIYDDYLRGEEGGIQTEVDSRGRELKVLGIREPKKGKDITLTIDMDMEKYIDSLLDGYQGAVIVMDSQSGEILSLISKPDFDPNIFVSHGNASSIRELLKRKDYPLVNRTISGTYPPGSVFKIVTASAGLGLGKIKTSEQLGCKGFYIIGNRRFNCWKSSGHGFQAITEGIKNSCNVFFYQLGLRVGAAKLADYASKYGFGKPSGIDLPYESSGIVPTRAWKRREKKESWFDGDTANYSIGQ
ncbi:MAG: penicillin-binding protein 2, partial [Candidatus Omnitrophota bacterium]|nr:penicillin-binding protein 2 [Candidatus Omnitrophota bacterium]